MFNRFYKGTMLIFSGENIECLRETVEDITPPRELLEVAEKWFKLSAETGDLGSCVLGAGLHFEYKNQKYEMYPQSPWQGEHSWLSHKDYIIGILKDLGATNINYEYGIMD